MERETPERSRASWLGFLCRLHFRLKKEKKRGQGLQKEGLLPSENWVSGEGEGDNPKWATSHKCSTWPAWVPFGVQVH